MLSAMSGHRADKHDYTISNKEPPEDDRGLRGKLLIQLNQLYILQLKDPAKFRKLLLWEFTKRAPELFDSAFV